MPLTEKQQKYLLSCSHRWNCKVGAVGSGKSYVDIAVTIPKRIMASKGEGLLVLMGNSRGTLERNILEPMRNLYPSVVGNIRQDSTVTMFGKKVYALGADNKKHVQRIQGATFEYVYGDEVTTWNQEVFEMLKSRLRCEHSHFDGTCNPASPRHWFKLFLDSDADIYCQSYQIEDGVMPPEMIAELKKEYAGTVYYDRLILGEWCQAEGLVYPMFCEDNITHEHLWDISEKDRERYMAGEKVDIGEWYLSIDYGTMNPTAMELWRVTRHGITMEREYYYDGRNSRKQKTDEEYYTDLEAFVGSTPIKRIIIDPSAASFKATIHRHGKYHTQDADNSVLDGIRLAGTMISQGQLKIHESCKNTLEEFGLYRWDESKDYDAVIKENDHAMDAMRYMCMAVRNRINRRPYQPIYMNV